MIMGGVALFASVSGLISTLTKKESTTLENIIGNGIVCTIGAAAFLFVAFILGSLFI